LDISSIWAHGSPFRSLSISWIFISQPRSTSKVHWKHSSKCWSLMSNRT
jgi:hypothetical protein